MKRLIRFICITVILFSIPTTALAASAPEDLLRSGYAQIYYNLFMIFVLPIIIGFVLGICLWRLKKTYFLSGIMLLAGVVWWCILSFVHTHGSEGPGLLAWMYSLMALSFAVVEMIKCIVRKLKAKS